MQQRRGQCCHDCGHRACHRRVNIHEWLSVVETPLSPIFVPWYLVGCRGQVHVHVP